MTNPVPDADDVSELLLFIRDNADDAQEARRFVALVLRLDRSPSGVSGMTETPERPELLPCPFCGGDSAMLSQLLRDGYAEFKDDPDAYAYTIRCHACAAEGGWAKSESGARRWWNTRTARASSLGEPVSQEAPYDWEGSYTMLRDALDANLGEFIRDGEEAEEYLYVQGIERAASVISSASPLSEEERREIVKALNDAASFIDSDGVRIGFNRAQNIASKLKGLGVWLDRLSASAPSPE